MTDAVARLTTALADRYRIIREVGSGGMATVYLANDVRHERKVALKVLRPELAAVIGAERFLAEIKTTAHLQHAHILGLIDSGSVNGTVFYVMPFVEGESLRDRLDREKQLPVADAVRIAMTIAGALDYAHRRGVIHRDIKPANILLHEGQALIADFGIALAITRTETSTTGSRMTETGMSLGTPQYMSPEQAMGERNIDTRTDIYSLGCVLYEMLTGEPPFTGPTAQAIFAKVMGVDPEPVTTLRRSVPANVGAATMTALNKVPADRFATAAEFSEALGDPRYVGLAGSSTRAAAIAKPSKSIIVTSALLAIAIVAAIAGWMRSSVTPSPIVARFEIPLPASASPGQFVVSPDGSRIFWGNNDAYFERRLDSLSSRRLRDVAIPQTALRAISPNGREVLIGGRGGMAIAPLAQGPSRSLAANARGGAWGTDGYIYFAFGNAGSPRGIARVRAGGGAVDTLSITGDLGVPSDMIVLPGSKALVVVLNRAADVVISTFDLDKKAWHALGISGSAIQFVAPRFLVYTSGQYIMAAPFDVKRLAVTQPSIPIAEAPGGSVERFAVGGNVLAYLPAPDPLGVPGIAVRSRSGTERLLPNVPDSIIFSGFTMSQDAGRLAAVGTPRPAPGASPFAQGISNIYVFELASGRMSRWRSDVREGNPSWMPGGRDLSFVRITADSPATATLMRRPWDASAEATPIYTMPAQAGGRGSPMGSAAWLADGRGIMQIARGVSASVAGRAGQGRGQPPTQNDLVALSLANPDSLRPFIVTDFSEGNPVVSPDGRAVAYTSNESGRNEVYIRPLSGGALRQVSVSGGTQPKWARSGRELFFRNADTIFAARVTTDGDVSADRVVPVLSGGNLNSGYAVGPGDSSFIMRAAPTGQRPATVSLIVVINIATELERLFGGADRRPPP
ncbi:MAG: protein kinase [bacterium]